MCGFHEELQFQPLPHPWCSPSLPDDSFDENGVSRLDAADEVAKERDRHGLRHDPGAEGLHLVLHPDLLEVGHAVVAVWQLLEGLRVALHGLRPLRLRVPRRPLLAAAALRRQLEVVAALGRGPQAKPVTATLASEFAPLLHDL
eukprot:CAMPEP_0115762010 /NCGR_PEP_ID=MMETSP0272-20121206/100802_1 /TAXON_ID=71861 /ORGANISM="Scrippsiella trochoidea, Strain CCMP3099" /LENGTH=143 /DNA_ID=CAMNT_0003207709 /DNA_START=40 /DNA_END=467 /DNA_ORIENTATION=-